MTIELERAANAQIIIDNPEFQAAITDIEQGIIARWKAIGITDIEAQTYLKLMHKIHGDFVATLKQRLNSGKMAEIKIERKNKVVGMFRT